MVRDGKAQPAGAHFLKQLETDREAPWKEAVLEKEARLLGGGEIDAVSVFSQVTTFWKVPDTSRSRDNNSIHLCEKAEWPGVQTFLALTVSLWE